MYSLNDVYNSASAEKPIDQKVLRSKTIVQPRKDGAAANGAERRSTLPHSQVRDQTNGNGVIDEIIDFEAVGSGLYQGPRTQ